ncbi:hypothetical protein SDC9_170754 [bioreactor metagenome]|uniref:Uncharacterized protein n=1 Tax=bioreactor metagenome TaxID=1076179 RepID=A0A645GB66_9ZZZZ
MLPGTRPIQSAAIVIAAKRVTERLPDAILEREPPFFMKKMSNSIAIRITFTGNVRNLLSNGPEKNCRANPAIITAEIITISSIATFRFLSLLPAIPVQL